MQTEIPIDEAGRVVIPKEIRDEWGLRSRGMLTLIHESGDVRLAPARPKGRLIRKGNMLVWSTGGETLTQKMVDDTIETIREERIRAGFGLDDSPDAP